MMKKRKASRDPGPQVPELGGKRARPEVQEKNSTHNSRVKKIIFFVFNEKKSRE